MLKSTEFRTRLLKGWFQAYLGRQPTDVELNFYLSHFAAGETDEMIQAEILGSTEFVGAGRGLQGDDQLGRRHDARR